MALVIYDQGVRIQTPVSSLFKERSIEATAANSAGSALPGDDQSAQQETLLRQQQRQAFDSELHHYLPENNARPENKALNLYNQTDQKPRRNSVTTLTAKQVMAFPVHTITTEVTLRATWQQMSDLKIEHLVVVNEDYKTLGVISTGDILRRGTDSPIPVAQAYQKQMVVAAPDTDLSLIVQTFIRYPVEAIVVLAANNKLQGIITRTDLLRLLINNAKVDQEA